MTKLSLAKNRIRAIVIKLFKEQGQELGWISGILLITVGIGLWSIPASLVWTGFAILFTVWLTFTEAN